jgi:hypothetical protein
MVPKDPFLLLLLASLVLTIELDWEKSHYPPDDNMDGEWNGKL